MITAFIQPTANAETENEMLFCLHSSDHRHFQKLYDRFAPALMGQVLKWIKDKEIAENLLQDVFIKAWRFRNLYDAGKGRLFTWLYRIARNLCIDHLRSKENRNKLSELTENNMQGHKTTGMVTGLYTDGIGLRNVVEMLRQEEKEVVDLVYFKGFTQRQVAETMNIPLGTVKTRMNKAIKDLRYYFKTDWKEAMKVVSMN